MKIKELMDRLQEFDPDAEIGFDSENGFALSDVGRVDHNDKTKVNLLDRSRALRWAGHKKSLLRVSREYPTQKDLVEKEIKFIEKEVSNLRIEDLRDALELTNKNIEWLPEHQKFVDAKLDLEEWIKLHHAKN